MTQKQKEKILSMLDDLCDCCGDALGRDGEYLADKVIKLEEIIEKIKTSD
jgi:ADP-ribosylglycohydrolase